MHLSCAYFEENLRKAREEGKSTYIEVLEGGTKNHPKAYGFLRDRDRERLVSYRIGRVVRGVKPSEHYLIIDFTEPETKEFSYRVQTEISQSGYFFVISPLVTSEQYGVNRYPVRVRLIAKNSGKIIDEVQQNITFPSPPALDSERQFGMILKPLPKEYKEEFKKERAIKYFKFP